MDKFITKSLFKKKSLLWGWIILCSILTTINAFSIKIWGRDCCTVAYRAGYNYVPQNIEIYFKFFHSDLTPSHQHGYIENFSASYSSDGGKTFNLLFSAAASDHHDNAFSSLTLTNKMEKALIQFSSNPTSLKVKFWNEKLRAKLNVERIPNHPLYHDQTWICMKWFPDFKRTNVTQVRLQGNWFVNGVEGLQQFSETFPIKMSEFKSMKATSSRGPVSPKLEVAKVADEILIKGTEKGERIEVYSTSGVLLIVSISKDDVTKIKLPKNQKYAVKVGQTSYKVAL